MLERLTTLDNAHGFISVALAIKALVILHGFSVWGLMVGLMTWQSNTWWLQGVQECSRNNFPVAEPCCRSTNADYAWAFAVHTHPKQDSRGTPPVEYWVEYNPKSQLSPRRGGAL